MALPPIFDTKDQLAFTDGKIKADSVNIHTGTWQVSDEDGAYHLKRYHKCHRCSLLSSADGRSLTVSYWRSAPRQRDDHSCDAYLDKVPANTSYKNNATYDRSQEDKNKVADILYQFLDEEFNGEKYSFTILQKRENGQALCRCCLAFAVIADDTGGKVGTITTDEGYEPLLA